MIIITENGPRSFYNPISKDSPEVLKLERVWRDAWNQSANEFNLLVERTRSQFGRMMDVQLLPILPDGEVRVWSVLEHMKF